MWKVVVVVVGIVGLFEVNCIKKILIK